VLDFAAARSIDWSGPDTHGFAIPGRARASRPNLASTPMDEETPLALRELWPCEKEQDHAATLSEDVCAGLPVTFVRAGDTYY
jgi:hypothetical protein